MADAPASDEASVQEAVAPETREVETPPEVVSAPEVEARPAAEPPSEWAPPTKEYAAFAQSLEVAGSGTPRAEDAPRRAEEAAASAGVWSYDAAEAPGAQAGDAATAGAGDVRRRVARVREETRARVGRMRDEAIVVLEETPDDSGLRFVIAAAALFGLFLLLLFLSTTVLR